MSKKGHARRKLVKPWRLWIAVLILLSLIIGIAIGISTCVKNGRPEHLPEESVVWVIPEESEAGGEQETARGRLALSELPGQLEAMVKAVIDTNRENYEKDPDLLPSEARLVVGYKYCLLLSPGHGALDPGSINEELGIKEKDINLALALAIRDYIEDNAADIKVMMSRTDDTLLSYAEQAELANTQQVDFILLLHSNSFYGAGIARGVEAMYQKAGDPEVVKRSAEAAALLTGAIAGALETQDRGLAKDNELDIGLGMPGVLVEAGFISDSVEGARLASPEYQQKVGEAVGRTLIDILYTYPVRVEDDEEQ